MKKTDIKTAAQFAFTVSFALCVIGMIIFAFVKM
jgi:cbb3-type cytochrome oxidase subunit 3